MCIATEALTVHTDSFACKPKYIHDYLGSQRTLSEFCFTLWIDTVEHPRYFGPGRLPVLQLLPNSCNRLRHGSPTAALPYHSDAHGGGDEGDVHTVALVVISHCATSLLWRPCLLTRCARDSCGTTEGGVKGAETAGGHHHLFDKAIVLPRVI